MADFNLLPQDFDTILAKMRQNVKDDGTFTDYNVEGSYLSTYLRQVAHVFELASYMINASASESHMDKVKLYENANSLSKQLSYMPKGALAPEVDVDLKAYITVGIPGSVPNPLWYFGPYVIVPKYTSFETKVSAPSGKKLVYSTVEDVILPFDNGTTASGSIVANGGKQYYSGLETFSGSLRLAQGTWSTITSTDGDGIAFRQIKLSQPTADTKISGDHIHVYDADGNRLSVVGYLTDYGPTDAVCEVRLNENKEYEITFGDGINGKLSNGAVTIKYLLTEHVYGSVYSGALTDCTSVTGTVYLMNQGVQTAITASASSSVVLPGTTPTTAKGSYAIIQGSASSAGRTAETVYEVRNNAIRTFSTHGTLVTTKDYRNHYLSNYKNLVHDCYSMNNWEYMTTYMADYFRTGGYGLEDPRTVQTIGRLRSLASTVLQADSCDFNNIYVVAVPTAGDSLSSSAKTRLANAVDSIKTATTEVVIIDPVYVYIVPMVAVVRSSSISTADAQISSAILKVLTDFFAFSSQSLGTTIDISGLRAKITAIPGVERIVGLSLLMKDGVDFTSDDTTTEIDVQAGRINSLDIQGLIYSYANTDMSRMVSYDYQLPKYSFPKVSAVFSKLYSSATPTVVVASTTKDSMGYVEY
jgi:hypothetical protein